MTFNYNLNHRFPDPLRVELIAPTFTLRVVGGEITPDQCTLLVGQITTAVKAELAAQLAPFKGEIDAMKTSLQEEITKTVADEGVADQIVTGIGTIEAKIADVEAKLLAADDEADIKALSDEHAKLSGKLAAGLAAITPATTAVPPVVAAASGQ